MSAINRIYIFESDEIKQSNKIAFNYDALRFICSLQGVLNREKPVLFIDYSDKVDKFWLDYISSDGKFLHGADFVHLKSIDEVIEVFFDEIKDCGLVLWDKAVPSTLNVAATICGVLDCLPVCGENNNEFYEYLKQSLPNVRVRFDLTNKFDGKPGSIIYNTDRQSTGSAKCDAYIYALENFFNKTSDDKMGYMLDGAGKEWLIEENSRDYENAFVPNVDYLIANRAFIFELSPWDDETPCDDKNQPLGTDYSVFCEILERQAEKNKKAKITSVTGFTPWQTKYTDHKNKSKHGAVATEWRHAELLSAHNCIMDADAYGYCGLFNASLYRHYPLKEKYINTRSSSREKREKYDENKIYILIYMGDYDSAAWLSKFAPMHFNDKKRGKNPLMWCFNPNLSERVPMVFDYVYENKTENDFFAAGDSGAGYLNPSLLFSPRIFSDFPDADSLFIDHNKYYFEKFGIRHVGFIINGHHKFDEKVYNMYAEFIKGGAGHNGHREPVYIKAGVPFMGYLGDLPGTSSHLDGSFNVSDIDKSADMIIHWSKEKLYKNFMLFRTILWSPSMIDALVERLKEKDPLNEYVFLNPDDFFDCLQKYMSPTLYSRSVQDSLK